MIKGKTTKKEVSKGDLENLTRLIRVIAAPIAIEQVEKLASTDERKKIWVLCSGKLTREKISAKSGVSLRTTTTFIDLAMTYGLLEEEKGKGGHPRRVIDYVPSDWKGLLKKKKDKQKSEPNVEKS